MLRFPLVTSNVYPRKLLFRKEAIEAVSKMKMQDIDSNMAFELHKLDCYDCKLHDVSNPKSTNCRDNPYCLKRLGLEKFEKLLKTEQSRADKVVKDQKRRDLDDLPAGLENYGNFCYVNSFLQVWFNEPVFRQIIYDWRPSPDYERPAHPFMDIEAVMDSLQHLFYTLEMTPYEATNAHMAFIQTLRLPNEQQDPQELTGELFNALDRNLAKHPNGEVIRQAIRDRCAGTVEERTWCECGGKDRTSELTMPSIHLPINEHRMLSEALDSYFGEEILSDCRCDSCGEIGGVRRRSLPKDLPNVLMLQLKRSIYKATGPKKLSTPLAYPRKFSARTLSPLIEEDDDFDYELFAVMIHVGQSTSSGHYYDMVKHPVSGKWFKYNDKTVEPVKPPGCDRNNVKAPDRSRVDMNDCTGLVYRRKTEFTPFRLPPAERTDAWKAQMEERFTGETEGEVKLCDMRLAEVGNSFNALNKLFDSLKTHADKVKQMKDLAFLPTSLLSDILRKELLRAESVSENIEMNATANATGAEASVSEMNGVGNPNKKRKRVLTAEDAPQSPVAELLEKHRMPLCSHGALSLNSVLFGDVKGVSHTATKGLLTRYAISIEKHSEDGNVVRGRLLTGNDICVDCCKELKYEHDFTTQLDSDVALTKKIIADKKRCSMVCDDWPDDYLYVAKTTLKNYKKLVLREQEYQSKQLPGEDVLVFSANSTNGLSSCSKVVLVNGGGSVAGRTRPTRRRGQGTTEASSRLNTPTDYAADDDDIVILSSYTNGVIDDTKGRSTRSPSGSVSDGYRNRGASSTPADMIGPSCSTSRDGEQGQVTFNADLRCEHDRLNLATERSAVSPAEWERLSKYFASHFTAKCDDELCEYCLNQTKENEENDANLKEAIKTMKPVLRAALSRKVKETDYGQVFTKGICSEFAKKIANIPIRSIRCSTMPHICQNCVLCPHGNPFKPLTTEATATEEIGPCIVPLEEKEWTDLTAVWEDMVTDNYATPIFIKALGVVDDMCEQCYGENVSNVTQMRYRYQNGTIFVKMQADVDGSQQLGSSKSTRRTKQRNLVKVHDVSSCETVRDLKIKLYISTGQSPTDQMLYNDGHLLDDAKTLEHSRVMSNPDHPLILITKPASPGKSDEQQRAPERGFTGTALAH